MKFKIFVRKGELQPCNPSNRIHIHLDRKGQELCIYGSFKYTFSYEKEGCPLATTKCHILIFLQIWTTKGLKLCKLA